MRRSRPNAAGMTLIELMVSMTVLVVVIGWVLVAYTNQQRSQLDHERVIEAQHEGRLITDLIVSDLRMAGFLMPTWAAVASVDGGNAASDALCVSDHSVIDPTVAGNQNQRFSGASGSNVAAGTSTVNVAAGDLDVDGNGTADFAVGGGIILSDGVNIHCAEIQSIAGGTITFAPAPANTIGVGTIAVPALYYEMNGTDLLRNGTVLSSQVEDVQIEFWVDTNRDSVMDAGEFPLHGLAGADLDEVRLARVSVTSRSTRNDSQLAGGGFPAVANRAAGPADDFKRRRQIAETLLRNVR